MKVTEVVAATAVLTICCLAAGVTCYRQPLEKKEEQERNGNPAGNDCPKTAPWPCKSGQCLPFSFICDGREDCMDDGYDEDPALCTAKDRPASVILTAFIRRFQKWLVPGILGNGKPEDLAKLLTEEPSVKDYAKKENLTPAQTDRLVRTLEFAKDGRVLDLIMDGMPEEAYREVHALFGRIVQSGFLGTEAGKD